MKEIRNLMIAAILPFSLLVSCGESQKKQEQTNDQAWKVADSIRTLIVEPTFAKKDFIITDYGASSDSTKLSTTAINQAIEACHLDGGGSVIVPQGTFLTGAIHLKSNVNLHLEDGAKLLFSRNTEDYKPLVKTRWEGMECMNYSPLIYAYGQENIAITGKGILDGNANNEHWWPWKAKKEYGWAEGMDNQLTAVKKLTQEVKDGIPVENRVYGDGHFLRPPFIQPYNSSNILIADVKIINAPFWNINPVLCENVTVRNVSVVTHGPNNDGCNPESSKNVLITNCYFDTGDDCIAIKSGRNEDGRTIGRPAENHIIENCEMKDGHGGIVIGSEISGGAKNIFAQNLKMDSPELDRVLRIKTSSLRGGVIENIYMRNVEVGAYKEAAVLVDMFYENPGDFMPTVRNITVENLNVKKGGKFGVLINAYEESPAENLRIVNSNIEGVDVPIQANYTKGMSFENVSINGKLVTDEDIQSDSNAEFEKF
ncbi:glycoside hydrolase family 28 protein [Sphingobacterium corticibacterium]|uniref:Glycoside hydrolase family 28 protein n=1 Tax=Sphingobacterium corticibacterium TaxID=2484746 RepID=A0A4Q6XI32_9SPHI|nr:glycoside hydrolase family 28 protein [Sphingobacterium corticibacterium]RZF59313.1 glycoside hydrolase family 28 protein [Sphingobacterium corticibacterium]